VDQRRVVYAAFAVVAAAAWWQAQSFGSGPGLLPRLASGALGALALVGLFLPGADATSEPSPGVRRAPIVMLAFVIYGVLMPQLGFLLTTSLLAAGFVLGFSGLRAWRWALGSVGFVALVYVAFSTIFFVTFPAGIAR
jgi:hypothetical protein